MKNGIPSEKISLAVTKQILEALVYLDDLNLIHRDLKPENILFKFEKDISIGIIDFGFATF